MSFRILYSNPGAPVAVPEPYEGYDIESAFNDYLPEGLLAVVDADGYGLELRGVGVIELFSGALDVAEHLTAPPGSGSEERTREFIPDIPPTATLVSMTFPSYMYSMPTIIFAADGADVLIYTRTYGETAGYPLVVLAGRDRDAPVHESRAAVVAELRAFLQRYLDDVGAAFPFIREHRSYGDLAGRLAALAVS